MHKTILISTLLFCFLSSSLADHQIALFPETSTCAGGVASGFAFNYCYQDYIDYQIPHCNITEDGELCWTESHYCSSFKFIFSQSKPGIRPTKYFISGRCFTDSSSCSGQYDSVKTHTWTGNYDSDCHPIELIYYHNFGITWYQSFQFTY